MPPKLPPRRQAFVAHGGADSASPMKINMAKFAAAKRAQQQEDDGEAKEPTPGGAGKADGFFRPPERAAS